MDPELDVGFLPILLEIQSWCWLLRYAAIYVMKVESQKYALK